VGCSKERKRRLKMKSDHHKSIVHAAADVCGHLLTEDQSAATTFPQAATPHLSPAWSILSEPSQVRSLADWASRCDAEDDVILEPGFAAAVIDAVSHPTSFQHLVRYRMSGALGYCWKDDPYLGNLECLGGMSSDLVFYQRPRWMVDESTDLGGVTPSTQTKCTPTPTLSDETNLGFNYSWHWPPPPGEQLIHGTDEWDEQIYPSAPALLEYYYTTAIACSRTGYHGLAFRCLGYALHLAADLTVPHHCIGTIAGGHAKWESDAWSYWRRLYADRHIWVSPDIEGDEPRGNWGGLTLTGQAILDDLSRETTLSLRAMGETGPVNGLRLEMLHHLPAPDVWPSRCTKAATKELSCLAIAATIRLVGDFARVTVETSEKGQ
jgi:hypothetical protein